MKAVHIHRDPAIVLKYAVSLLIRLWHGILIAINLIYKLPADCWYAVPNNLQEVI